jgi:dTDP-glucose pyrophosphorylase
MVNKLILKSDTAFEEAVSLLDKNGIGFLPVVNEQNYLIGILTDGDIRRAFLNKISDLDKIINKNPIVAYEHEPRHEIIRRLQALKRRQMPVVDVNGKFIDAVVLNDFTQRSPGNKVVIMAGGLGTRLGDLTRETPKPMLLINGKPILQRIIEQFKYQGFTSFILCLNYKSQVIMDHFRDGSELGVSIQYTQEEKRLGTAGALSLIDRQALKLPFIVTNADIITRLDFGDLVDTHTKSKADATLCVKQYSMQMPYANIMTDSDGNLVGLEEKPQIPFKVNAGIYVLNPLALEEIPSNEFFDMPSLLQKLKTTNKVVKTYGIDDYWIDVGVPQDFIRAGNFLQ